MTAKIQALEKLKKRDYRDMLMQTEEFYEEPISSLHYKFREEQPKVFKQPVLIYPVAFQEFELNGHLCQC